MTEPRLALVGSAGDGLDARAGQAIARATQWLVAAQHARGYWHAPLEANATMEAEYVFFNRILGRDKPDLDRRMAERLLAIQQADGSWPQYHAGPGNVSTRASRPSEPLMLPPPRPHRSPRPSSAPPPRAARVPRARGRRPRR